MGTSTRDRLDNLTNHFFESIRGTRMGRRLVSNASLVNDRLLMEEGILTFLDRNGAYSHLDVGACHGDWSAMVHDLFPRSRSVLIEPNPSLFYLLGERVIDGQVLVNAAITEIDHSSQEFFETVDPKGSSLHEPMHASSHAWLQVRDSYAVPTRRLDSIISEYEIPNIGILKIDTQGHDLRVLRSTGMHLHPSRIPIVIVEVNFQSFYLDQDDWWKVVEYLAQHEYSLVQMQARRSTFGRGLLSWADFVFAGKTAIK